MGASSSPRLVVLPSRRARERARAPRTRAFRPDRQSCWASWQGRSLGRAGLAVVAASAFAVLAYAYLTLPDVRPAADDQSPDDRVHGTARARGARAGTARRAACSAGSATDRISPNSCARCSSLKTMRSGSTKGWTSSSCRNRSRQTGRADGFVRGGSTITQQLAKNLYLSPSKNPLRKLRELIIARRLEAELKKSRILELYLNVIEWGDGIYGAEAAARDAISRNRAAELLGRRSRRCSPRRSSTRGCSILHVRPPGSSRRQQLILRRMGVVTRLRKSQLNS